MNARPSLGVSVFLAVAWLGLAVWLTAMGYVWVALVFAFLAGAASVFAWNAWNRGRSSSARQGSST
jgi:hypothetical protein